MLRCYRCDGLGRLTPNSAPCVRCKGTGDEPPPEPKGDRYDKMWAELKAEGKVR